MNPVLASTLDFDNYVKEKLRASRMGIPRSSSASKPRKENPKDGKESSGAYPLYNRSTTLNNPTVSSRNSIRTSRVAEQSPSSPTFEIAHSWRAHLRPANREITVPTLVHPPMGDRCALPDPPKSVETGHQKPNEGNYSEMHRSAPPYLDMLDASFAKSMSLLTPSPNIHSMSQENFGSYNIKIRIFRLKKLFRAWRAQSLRAVSQLQRFARSTTAMHQEYLLISFFDDWKFQWLAATFSLRQVKIKAKQLLACWAKRSRQSLQWNLLVRHFYMRRAYNTWAQIISEKRKRDRMAGLERHAVAFRHKKLLVRVVKEWKRYYRTEKLTKDAEGSRQVTLDRIQSFLQRLDATNEDGPSKGSSINKNQVKAASSHLASGRGISSHSSFASSSTNAGNDKQSRLRPTTTINNSQVGTTARSGSATRRRSIASNDVANSNSTRSVRNNERKSTAPIDKTADFRAKVHHQSENASSQHNKGHESKAWIAEEDNWNESEPRHAMPRPMASHFVPSTEYLSQPELADWSAPPSYRQFATATSGNSSRLEDKESFSLTSIPKATAKSTAVAVAEAKDSAKFPERAQTSHKELANPEADTRMEQLTSRKDRLAYLQQRAQERVQRRRDEILRQQELKVQQEAEEAARIFQEAKRKKQEHQERSLLRKQEVKESQILVYKADAFHRKALLIQYGFAPWMRYLYRLRNQGHLAERFCHAHILERYWQYLRVYVYTRRSESIRREYGQLLLAANHHRRKLLRTIFRQWQLFRKLLRAKARAIMGHFSRRTLPQRIFQAWKMAYARSQRQQQARLQREIIPHGNRVVRRYYWRRWLDYLHEQRLEREVNYRSEMKWQAVRSWMHK